MIVAFCRRMVDRGQDDEVRGKSDTCEDRPQSDYDALIEQWVKDGQLEEHSDNQIDFNKIESDIVELTAQHNVFRWWYDQKFATQMAQSLINEHGIDVEAFGQTASNYNEPIRVFLRELEAGNIWHDGCPCTTWQALNLVVHANHGDEWAPDKSHRQKKIDVMVATLMAFAQCVFSPAEEEQVPALFFG